MNKNGFTLVEITLGMLIGGIAILISTVIILSVTGYYSGAAKLNENKQFVDGVFSYLTDNLKSASQVELINGAAGQTPKYPNIIHSDDGELYLNDTPFDQSLLGSDKQVTYSAKADGALITFTVTLTDSDGDVLYTDDCGIRVNYLSRKGRNIEGVQGILLSAPLISYDNIVEEPASSDSGEPLPEAPVSAHFTAHVIPGSGYIYYNLVITNLGTEKISDWTFSYTYTGGRIISMYSASTASSGAWNKVGFGTPSVWIAPLNKWQACYTIAVGGSIHVSGMCTRTGTEISDAMFNGIPINVGFSYAGIF